MDTQQDLEQIVIATDLDGCLIDDKTSSYELSESAYRAAEAAKIPISFVTGKSAALAHKYVRELDNPNPFIAENGSVIYVPEDFLSHEELSRHPEHSKWLAPEQRVRGGTTYNLLEYNVDFETTNAFLKNLQKELADEHDIEIRLYNEMPQEEFKRDVGLSGEDVLLDQDKEYHSCVKIVDPETDGFDDDSEKIEILKEELQKAGYQWSRGRYHLVGKGKEGNEVSKAVASKVLRNLYEQKYGKIHMIGLGDSQSDLGFLETSDTGFLVQKPGNKHVDVPENSSITKIDKVGPAGWSKAIYSVLER